MTEELLQQNQASMPMELPGENEAYVWNDLYGLYLFPSLKVLTLPWAKPFLPEMGLPQFIVEKPEEWTPIYEAMFANYTELHNTAVKDLKPGDGHEYHTRIDPRTTLQAFLGGLKQLVNIAGKETAVELEHWVRRHFLSYKIEVALWDWGMIFCYAVLPAKDRKNQIPPPDFIAGFLQTMENLRSFWKDVELEERLKAAMPTPSAEELALTEGEILLSNDARLLEKVILQQSAMEILKLLAKNLNEQHKRDFIEWVNLQGGVISTVRVESLCEEIFFRIELPFINSPSLLDLPPTFDLIDYRF
jgi:hypothetical protein